MQSPEPVLASLDILSADLTGSAQTASPDLHGSLAPDLLNAPLVESETDSSQARLQQTEVHTLLIWLGDVACIIHFGLSLFRLSVSIHIDGKANFAQVDQSKCNHSEMPTCFH